MQAHPIMESSRRWIPVLLMVLVAIGVQAWLLTAYAGVDLLSALVDGAVSIGLFCGLAYLSWFVIGFVSSVQTEIIVSVLAILFWLVGGFALQGWIETMAGSSYLPFAETLPFRALVGALCWTNVMMWYKYYSLQALRLPAEEIAEVEDRQNEEEAVDASSQSVEEYLDRITVKDGARIHLVATNDLIYVQACGDYVTLFTPEGQFVKELTMKYLEKHLPVTQFVRVHRSTIVNVTQILRVELFGKETYRLLLKNGDKLRVSLSGYKLLKTRLDL